MVRCAIIFFAILLGILKFDTAFSHHILDGECYYSENDHCYLEWNGKVILEVPNSEIDGDCTTWGRNSQNGHERPYCSVSISSPVSFPPPNCIVKHAATPIQFCHSGDGYRVYHISTEGKGITGPYIGSVEKLKGFVMPLWIGINPSTGYLVSIGIAGDLIWVRTFDHHNKRYIFSIDNGHNVEHMEW